MRSLLRYRPLLLLAFLLVSLNLFLAGFLLWGSGSSYPELAELQTPRSFPELTRYLRDLSEKKGAPYAYQVLIRMPSVPGVDMHLLGHTVGDELYKQFGLEGMAYCTSDLRNACSHSVVIGALLEHGPSILKDVSAICRKAPGGSGAYNMCYHGLGHGVLAYTDYELSQAVGLCKRAAESAGNKANEYQECIGGTIMEMTGGVHDAALRIEKSKKYFKKEDPLYPCDADFMPSEVRGFCYTYLTPHLMEAAGGDLAAPKSEDFKIGMTYCDKLTDIGERRACFGGFGKEFPVILSGRDVRGVAALPESALKTMYEWCSLAPTEGGRKDCSFQVLASLYWGGENDFQGSLRYCSAISDQADQKDCFARFVDTARYFRGRDAGYMRNLCAALPDTYDSLCAVTR